MLIGMIKKDKRLRQRLKNESDREMFKTREQEGELCGTDVYREETFRIGTYI